MCYGQGCVRIQNVQDQGQGHDFLSSSCPRGGGQSSRTRSLAMAWCWGARFCLALQNYLSRKSTQFRDNLKRTKSATKLDRRKPDVVVVVANGSATVDDRSTVLSCFSSIPVYKESSQKIFWQWWQIKSWFDLNHSWLNRRQWFDLKVLCWFDLQLLDLSCNFMIWFAIWANHRLNRYQLQ